MKCPNCGFVTFPDPAECKKCGHRFAPGARRPERTASSVTFRSPDRPFVLSSPEPEPPTRAPERARITPKTASPASFAEAGDAQPFATRQTSGSGESTREPDAPPASPPARDEAANPWHEEIAARVARYRRRRGLQDEPGRSNFEFEFEEPPEGVERADTPAAADIELKGHGRPRNLEIDLDGDSRSEAPNLDAQRDRDPEPEPRDDAAEWALQPVDFRASERPVEIVLDSGQRGIRQEDRPSIIPKAAPLGRRFAAGLLDALVLVVAGTVFFVLFRASGGHVVRQPASLAIFGFAAAFLMVFYFSAFTALAFATPGQSAVGLRVRTFEGETPGIGASVWRGTGYLVSATSLMLGFLWAAFDAEHLTWHDYMSGTCLVERR